jgi:tellurite resistance protein TerC
METTAALAGLGSGWLWGGFLVFVLIMLALDLGVFHRQAVAPGVKDALVWSGVWIALACLFGAGVYRLAGAERALEFFTGYLVEKSLSVDNIFVFVLVFGSLGVPAAHQHRVLFWGILSALALRAGMILGGAALLERFHALVYVFGAFLVVTGAKMLLARRDGHGDREGRLLAWARRAIPSTPRLDGSFFAREGGKLLATPLLVALILIEITDVVFAVDSLPAILAISDDRFIVFTSNIFALLGLRSLYFAIAGAAAELPHLKTGLAAVLVFVGAKMLIAPVFHLPALASLAVIAALLGASVLASLRVRRACSSRSSVSEATE